MKVLSSAATKINAITKEVLKFYAALKHEGAKAEEVVALEGIRKELGLWLENVELLMYKFGQTQKSDAEKCKQLGTDSEQLKSAAEAFTPNVSFHACFLESFGL